MGNNVWIGEYSSLRDSTHQFSTTSSLGTLPDTTKPIIIGNNVWIGRGCLIMPGTIIEDNVIIAANSVVKTACSSGKVYGGCPAVFIKNVN
jgi:acetyltransferase-like isoleucine patch superfamily enzyme